MRVCLLAPRIPPAPMNFQFAMDLVGCAFSHIPLPLATLAALTPAGVDVRIVDENVEPIDLDLDADVVAFSGIYCQRRRLFELADAFRARGRRVVIGGAIATDLPDECRAHCDHLFIGEAEYTWPRFIDDLRRGEPAAEYRQDEPIDMRDSPVPRFELLRVERYSSACVQATRGCPHRCEYCEVPTRQGARPRSKPVAQVLEEVRRLAALGFDSIFFVDDYFVGNRKYARELLTALAGLVAELPTPVYFYAQVTLNIARDDEMLALFHAAHFRRFFVGIETSDHDKLRAIKKPQNTEMDVREAVARIQSFNITVWAGIILGLDDDDASSFDAQYRFIMESGITPTLIGLLQAMPGAPLYDRAKREGRLRLLPDTVGSGALGTVEAQATTNLMPKKLGLPALHGGYSQLVRRVFAPEAYGTRILMATARGTRGYPPIRKSLSARNFRTVARTLAYYLRDADGPSRRMLLRVLLTLAARRGRAFEEIIYHLVIYKHLRTYYDDAARAAETAAAS